MTVPVPPTPVPPTPVPPPTVSGDAKSISAWTLYQQQLQEFNNPRPTPPPPVVPVVPPAVRSIHPDWVNPCEQCNAQIQAPCTGPTGFPLAYVHAPRIILGAQSGTLATPPPTSSIV